MSGVNETVLCPTCGLAVQVAPDWRLVQCPRCGAMVSRMTDEPAYD